MENQFNPNSPSFVALVILFLLFVVILLKQKHDMHLINKAARILNIQPSLIVFFHTELLSLYKHQPFLKDVTDYVDFRQIVATNDGKLLDAIYQKESVLREREYEYGEAFLDEYHSLT